MKCLNCGQNYQPEDRFCVQCGAEIIKPDEATQNVPTASTMTEDQQLQSTSKQSQKKDDVNNERQLYKKTTSVHQTTRKRSTLEENDSFVEEITDDNMSSMEYFFKDLQIEGKKFFTHVFKSVDDIFENQVTFNYRFFIIISMYRNVIEYFTNNHFIFRFIYGKQLTFKDNFLYIDDNVR